MLALRRSAARHPHQHRPPRIHAHRALTFPGFGQAVVDAESEKTPTRRTCTPEDIASAITYLASGRVMTQRRPVLLVAA